MNSSDVSLERLRRRQHVGTCRTRIFYSLVDDVNMFLEFCLDFIIFVALTALKSVRSDTLVVFSFFDAVEQFVADLAVQVQVQLLFMENLVSMNSSNIIAKVTFEAFFMLGAYVLY